MVEDTATQDVMVDLNNSGIDGAAERPVLDAACMAELQALDPDGKAQLVKRVLAAYQGSLAKLVEQLRQGRADGAWEPVSRVAHTLKSSSASIGALAFSAVCGDIERHLRAGETAAADALIDRFHAEAAHVEIAVAQALRQFETAAS
jgi:HPt (histidine-containing phosphotransfer) domain-containing protein